MIIGEMEQKTNFRFRSVEDFETNNIAIDVDYDSEDVIYTGWLYKMNTPQINMVNRSQNGRGTDFKQDVFEYIGNNCSITTSSYCFKKCINPLTDKDCTEDL